MAEEKKDRSEMTVIDHLDELRGRMVKGSIAILGVGLIALIYVKEIFHYIILAPTRVDFITYRLFCDFSKYYAELTMSDADKAAGVVSQGICIDKLEFRMIATEPTEQFTKAITTAMVTGIIVAFPYVFWQLWQFVAPGLREKERKNTKYTVLAVSTLFFIGCAFGYFVAAPMAIGFLANYQLATYVENMFTIGSIISLLMMTVVGCGILFQLPVVVYFLTKIGILSPDFMRKYRKHAVVIIL